MGKRASPAAAFAQGSGHGFIAWVSGSGGGERRRCPQPLHRRSRPADPEQRGNRARRAFTLRNTSRSGKRLTHACFWLPWLKQTHQADGLAGKGGKTEKKTPTNSEEKEKQSAAVLGGLVGALLRVGWGWGM